VELRHLRYFVAVAAEGSLTRAAERLHITQPSLSRQMRQLERDLGAELFERTAAGTVLTAAGTALHRHAQLLVRLADTTREVTLSTTEQAAEDVQLGVPPGIPERWLLHVLDAVRDRVPRAAMSFTEANSADQLRLIRAGRLDLGLVREKPAGRLRARELFTVPFGLAVRPDHPLAQGSVCRVRDLDGLRILAHGREQVPVVDDRLILATHDAGAAPLWQFAQFAEHVLACAEAVRADAVLLIEHSARLRLPGWPWLPLVEPELTLVTWLAWPPDTRTVVDDVARVIGDHGNPPR
jgi:LysR family transcriptional regulator, benzoate and cis,cis-muconate-responsive activator of ben and cat genes